MIRKLLVAYDGSDSANKALDFASELTQVLHAELHVLAVARPPEFGDDVETSAVIESSRRQYQQALDGARLRLGQRASQAFFHLATGHPAEQIVRYAEANGIDHIVVGHRGHTLFERWLIGSVARQVIAYAPCAVTVVRQPPG